MTLGMRTMARAAAVAACAISIGAGDAIHESEATMDAFVLDHDATLSDGTEVRLAAEYEGKVLLIVNTASRCGYTPQYEGLQAVYKAYKERGFEVLAFPCNDFGGQEPGSTDEIVSFCTTEFDVEFPIFEKVAVLGEEPHPLYADLRGQPEPIGGPPAWNFTKYLVGRDGMVLERFDSAVKPESEKVIAAIEAALASDPEPNSEGEK